MELSFMNGEKEKYSAIDKSDEPVHRATPSLFDLGIQSTEVIMRYSSGKPTSKKPCSQGPSTGPTWSHLFGQIIIGVIEILIPLAFIVGMIYWRAPQLFWAVVHFLWGEPILNF